MLQVLRRLHIGHASILDQAHGLKLELSRKLPSLHDPPPAPSKHLTRCLRNRVQANWPPCDPPPCSVRALYLELALAHTLYHLHNGLNRVAWLVFSSPEV